MVRYGTNMTIFKLSTVGDAKNKKDVKTYKVVPGGFEVKQCNTSSRAV